MAGAKAHDGPFSGVLVIDLTHVLNGPFGTVMPSDLGARVIKVEAPGHGDDTRTCHERQFAAEKVHGGRSAS